MSSKFVNVFKTKIYKLLLNSTSIMNMVDNIYLAVPQDAPYPFVSLSVSKAVDISIAKQHIFELYFQIEIFARNHNNSNTTKLCVNIEDIIQQTDFSSSECMVIGKLIENIDYDLAKDLITNKTTMNCQIIIKKNKPYVIS